MSEFNSMTVVAAVEVISNFKSHSDMGLLEVEWGLDNTGISTSSKSARAGDWAKIAIHENPPVWTQKGQVKLERALIETAILSTQKVKQSAEWKKLVAGLRFDGFEIVETETDEREDSYFGSHKPVLKIELRRMLPQKVPETDFREATSEIEELLKQLNLSVAEGHLKQAISAFQRGEWSSANGELRNFYENYLNEISVGLGYSESGNSKAKRDYLGRLDPPFFLSEYNEWNENNQKPQYVQGLMSRMHPHGGHPGLSEEEDATFRLQISLITARLFLRRYKNRRGF